VAHILRLLAEYARACSPRASCQQKLEQVLEALCRMERHSDENKLFVGHLPADITEEDLRTVFTTYGEVSNIHLMGKVSDRGHTCAFVSYVKQEAAEDAIAVLDGKYKIRDSPDAEFICVSWKKQGASAPSNNSGWNNRHYSGSQWSSPQTSPSWSSKSSSSWGSDSSSSWNSSASNGWNSSGAGNSWQERPQSWGQNSGKSDSWSGSKGSSWGQSDWSSSNGSKGKSAPEPSNRLFVGNLPADISEDSLNYVFGTYGKVVDVHVITGKAKSGQSCALIEMGNVEEAETAIATLHEKYEIRPGDGPIMVKFGNPSGKGGKDRSSPY